MPAGITLVPCAVSWVASLGGITSAPTLWLFRGWVAGILWGVWVVGFAGGSMACGACPAADCALAAMAAIQPWSAAGAEKPMVTAFPGVAALGAAPPPLGAGAGAAAGGGGLPVHAASAAPAPAARLPAGKPPRPTKRATERAGSSGSGIVALLLLVIGGQLSARRARVWNSTTATMIRPLAMFWTSVARLLRMNRLVIVVNTSTPRIEPTSVPRPPVSRVPPMITAAIASSS